MIYLYDPINNYKIITNYELLENLTGKNRANLSSFKTRRRKITSLNSYIIDDSFTKNELYRLMCLENPKDEIWKSLDINSNYKISNYGRFKRFYKNGKDKLIIPYLKHNKWMMVKIYDGEKLREHTVHILVARNFLEEYKKGEPVYHKDENRFNNHADNLGFIERKELGCRFAGKSKAIPVLKLDIKTGEILDSYESMAEAGRENFITREAIRLCVQGINKTSGGFKWTIDNEFNKQKVI